MSQGPTKYRKYATFFLFLIFLTFLPPSQEFSFGWGGDDSSKSKEALASDASAGRKALKRPVMEKKHKFHKIERVILDDDDEEDKDEGDDDNDDDEENAEGNTSNDDNNAAEEMDDGGDDITEENASKMDKTASKHSADNDDEEEEFQFKRARKAEKVKKPPKGDTESQEKSKSWFGGFFGSSDNADTKDESQQAESAEAEGQKSNGIIDWIMWLGERTGRLRPDSTEDTSAPAASAESGDPWTEYFNRWPFNSLFPIGKPPKPIKMPKVAKQKSKDISKADESSAEPMSQESFDTLLHSLPNFIVNPSEVSDMECRQQLQIFQRQLRGRKLWTLQMMDATGKVGNGLLRGNINQFGDFNMCTDIKTIVKVSATNPVRIRGKYCLAHIELQTSITDLKVPVHMLHGRGLFNSHLGNPYHFMPRYGVANWGICVPSDCSGDVVRQMLQSSLENYNNTGVELHVEVDDNDCYVKQSRKFIKLLKKDKKFCATILYILGLTLLSLSTLSWEHWSRIKPILERIVAIMKIILAAMKTFGAKIKMLVEKLKKKTENNDEKETDTENKEPTEESATETEKETEAEAEQSPAEEEEAEKESPNEETKTETKENEAEAEATEEDPTENLSLNFLAFEIFKSFSPQRSFNILLASDSYDVQFPLFHVLKIAATFMLYLCLKFLMIGHMPITNRDQLVRTLDNPLSVLIRSPMIYADTLLLISGFLSAYQLSEEMEQKSYIQLLKRLALKVSRYLPTVYLLICFQTWILPYLNSGPLWSNIIGHNSRLCDDQWWRNILSLQNAIDFEETCSPSTIQLALEVQLYLVGPLIVWLYYTDSDAAFFVYGALHAMSVAARFSRTNKEHLSMTLFHGINVSKFYRTANILYSSPISRATTYLLGVGAGIYQRSNQGIVDLTPEMISFGWILASLGLFWCFWSPSSSMRTDFIYTSSDAASYASWCPLVFGLSLCWFIFMLAKSENSIVQMLTTSRVFLVLSRLVFPMQMVMYIMVLYGTAKVKEMDKFHLTDLVNIQEIALILLGAIVVAFLIDIPSQNIRRLIVDRIFIERPHHENDEHELLAGDGEAPSETSEEASERVGTSDTPEPPDTVWGSDPEEEEQQYLNRRRSSLLNSKELTTIAENKKESKGAGDEEEEEEEEIEEEIEEEEDISEAEEVKKHP